MKLNRNYNTRPAELGRHLTRLLCLLLLLAMAVPLLAPRANAASIVINGVPGGGIPGATSTASGSYAIYQTTATVGFRFTLVDASGRTWGKSYDIYEDSTLASVLWVTSNNGANAKYLHAVVKNTDNEERYTKMEYAGIYLAEPTLPTIEMTSTSDLGTYGRLDSALGLSLPTNAAAMAAWPDISFMPELVYTLWNMKLTDMYNNGYSIAIEPLYPAKIGGAWFCATVTEYAIMAASHGTAYSGTPSWTALVPIIGAFTGCILGAFFILVQDPLLAVWFVVLFLTLQQIEGNLIYPHVVGSSIGLPGMWVLLAVAVGGDLMGVAGMLVMIPLASVVYALGREFVNKRLEAREISPDKLQDQPQLIKSKFKEKREQKKQLKQEQKE